MCMIMRVIYVSVKKRLSFRVNVLSLLSVVINILACFSLLQIQRKMLIWGFIHLRMNWHYYRHWIRRLRNFSLFLQLIPSFIRWYHFSTLLFQGENLHTGYLSYACYSLLNIFSPKKGNKTDNRLANVLNNSKNLTLEVWLHPFFSTILMFIFQNFQTFSWNHFQAAYPYNLVIKIKQTLLAPLADDSYSSELLPECDCWSQLAWNHFQAARL